MGALLEISEIIRVILASCLVVIIPGYIFTKKVIRVLNTEIFIWCIWSGIFILPVLYCTLNEVLENFLITFLIVTLSFYIISLSKLARKKSLYMIFKVYRMKIFNRYDNYVYIMVVFAIFGLLVLRSYYPYLILNPIGPFGTDLAKHSFFIKNIIKYGRPLLNEHKRFYFGTIYPYTLHYLIASIVLVSGVAVHKVLLILSPSSYILIGIAVFIATKKLLDKNAALLALVSFTLLFPQPYQTLLDGSINELISIFTALCTLIIGIDYLENPNIRRSLLLGLTVGSITWFHPFPAFIFAPTIALLFCVLFWKARENLKYTLLSIIISTALLLASIAIRHQFTTYGGYIHNTMRNVHNFLTSEKESEYAHFPQSFYGLSFYPFLVLFSILICPFLTLGAYFQKRPIRTILLLSYFLSNFIFTMGIVPEHSNRILRDFTIPLSMILSGGLTSFANFIPRKMFLKIRIPNLPPIYIRMRSSVIVITFTLMILLSIVNINQLLLWQTKVAKTLNYLSPEIMEAISYLNSKEYGNIITDFSGAWLPYFYENGKVIINNPKKFNVKELFYNPDSKLAMQILRSVKARYIYLAYFGKGLWYPKNSLMPYQNLEKSRNFKKIYDIKIGKEGYVKIYKVIVKI